MNFNSGTGDKFDSILKGFPSLQVGPRHPGSKAHEGKTALQEVLLRLQPFPYGFQAQPAPEAPTS